MRGRDFQLVSQHWFHTTDSTPQMSGSRLEPNMNTTMSELLLVAVLLAVVVLSGKVWVRT
jgi:hypothetical protein